MMGQGTWQEANLELRRSRDMMNAIKMREVVVKSVEAYLEDLKTRRGIYAPVTIHDSLSGNGMELLMADEIGAETKRGVDIHIDYQEWSARVPIKGGSGSWMACAECEAIKIDGLGHRPGCSYQTLPAR